MYVIGTIHDAEEYVQFKLHLKLYL